MATTDATAPEKVAPFLRWAGGKRWLVQYLVDLLGELQFGTYHEPFLGGAAVFFGLDIPGRANLSDVNSDLIATYEQVRACPADVAALLKQHHNRVDHYYKVRAHTPDDPTARAARFIYLNHTSFNGIYRVNLDGMYNVPFGNRDNPIIPTTAHLEAAARRLAQAELRVEDFETAIQRVKPRDLVFLDPPYTVAHNLNGFIKYNQRLFSFEDQRRLNTALSVIRDVGAFYVLTNAAHESISTLFTSTDRQLLLSRRNVIGGKNAKRGSATEFLFTNVPEP